MAVNSLVRQVYDARREEQADQPAKLQDWGLEPPAAVITLKAGDRAVELKVGDSTGKGDNDVIYVLSPESKEPMAVRRNSLESVLNTLNDFRSRELLAANSHDIEAVTLSEGKKGSEPKVVELKKAGADRWQYVKPSYGDAEVEDGGGFSEPNKAPRSVNALLGDITQLKVDYRDAKDNDFVADGVKDLATYHLDPAKAPVLRIEVERTGESGKDASGSEQKKTARVALLVGVSKKADEKGDKYYACLADEPNVFKLSARSVEPFQKLLADDEALRDRHLIVIGQFKKPNALDIKNSYGVLEFRRQGLPDKWKLYRDGTGQEVAEQEVTQLVNTLTQKDQVRTFVDPKKRAQYGLDKPEVVVSLWVDGLEPEKKDEKTDDKKDDKAKDEKKDDKKGKKDDKAKPEKKDDRPKLKEPGKPTFQLRFGNRVEGQVVVERVRGDEKEGTLVRVPEVLLDMVKKGPLAYLDKTLPRFNPTAPAGKDVTRLVLERGGTTYQIGRGKEGAPWKFDLPKDLAGRKADPQKVEGILNYLNDLQAHKLVAEKADAAALDKEYNLRAPPVKAVVTVTRDGKPTAYEYAFGKDEDASHVYARQSQRDVVFVVDKQALAPLQEDLRDPTVLQFEADKVKAAKVTGWQNVVGSPLTLEVERKDATHWNVKKPEKFTLDEGKFNAFLAGLAHLRAASFVSNKRTAEQELDVNKGALAVELTVEGVSKPLELTVGKLDGDKGYFATSSQAPDTVFLVPRGLFEQPKEKPVYFKQ
jgi:hypothetical protein